MKCENISKNAMKGRDVLYNNIERYEYFVLITLKSKYSLITVI